MSIPRLAGFLLACALGWALAQAGLLIAAKGLLASYDFPSHLHMSAVQMRSPTALWDDAWYAGYPTYVYPPLAHRLAGELMERLGVERGFKLAVVIAYIAAVPAVYAAARAVAGLPPVAAAAATLVVSITPSLFRAFLFGQYPALVAYPLFLAALTTLVAGLHSPRRNPSLTLLASLLVAALGSTHLYTLLLLLVVLVPLAFVVNSRRLLSRVTLPLAGGAIMAAFPSLLLLTDMRLLSKTPVPHITRSVEMILPTGILNWLLYPAGLPVVVGALVLGPVLVGGRRWVWVGVGLAAGLVLYLSGELGLGWSAVTVLFALALGITLGHDGAEPDWRSRYLTWAGLISFWLALGPAGGLARLLPFSDVLVYDRPLLYGAPLAWLGLARILWCGGLTTPWRKIVPVILLVSTVPLLVLSLIKVMHTYAWLTPGAAGAIPRGTPLQADYTDFLKGQWRSGRVLPLGFPPIVYALPDLTGVPLIDGAYNDARVLTPLRRSGLEALGNEKFTNSDLRVTRFFLANADRYGIDWAMTADRYYDLVVPLERFMLVYESQDDVHRGVRIYRSIFSSGHAWVGDPRYRVSEISQISVQQARWGTGGGASGLEVAKEGPTAALSFQGSSEMGWAFTDLALPSRGDQCNRVAFDAWSPTRAALTVRVRQEGRFSILRPEAPLSPNRSSIHLAVDCRTAERVQVAISGVGEQRALLTPVRLQRVEDATAWVPFQRPSPECIRVTIPHARAPVTVSVPYFARWQTTEPAQGVTLRSDPRGLLTLTGPAGVHTLCLSFSRELRFARAYFPVIYLALAVIVGLSIWATHLALRPSNRSRVVLIQGALTTLREVVLRHHMHPEQAWDERARQAPDWFATFTKTREEYRESGAAELTEVLEGIDQARLRDAAVLEVGCGPGRVLEHLAPLVATAYGVDFSIEMVNLARERMRDVGNLTVLKNDGHTLSMFPHGKFDFVYTVNVFQHIPYRAWIESYVREIYRVLKSGGEAKIQADGRAESFLWRLERSITGHDSWAGIWLSRRELAEMARRCGFLVHRCEYAHGRGIRWRRQGLWLHVRKP